MSKTCETNCLVLGDPEEHIFTVEIQARKNISALRREIRIERGDLFENINSTKITLNTAFKQYYEIKDLTELPRPTLKLLLNIKDSF